MESCTPGANPPAPAQTPTSVNQEPPKAEQQPVIPEQIPAETERESALANAPELPGVPEPLAKLMREYGVQPEEIVFAVAQRGYFPADVSIADYPPDFVSGVLIGAWQQVYAMILDNRDATPF